jgi:hypothetical protein
MIARPGAVTFIWSFGRITGHRHSHCGSQVAARLWSFHRVQMTPR